MDTGAMTKSDEEKIYKIGDLSKLSGLSVRTLRGYEELGIVTPARSYGGTRFYGRDELAIAQVANRMRELDISVDAIKTIATKRREFSTGDQSSSAMIGVLEHLSDELSERAAKTLKLQDEVTRTLRLLRGCQGCKNRPSPQTCPNCPMEISPDRTAMAQMIWQST